ncbi:MAG: SNF2-related protein [Phocaeicola sp.]
MKLRNYQTDIANRASTILTQYGCCYLSMECRTGKTLTALQTATNFGARSVLFVTKLKAIGSIKGDYQQLAPSYTMEVINYESVHKAVGNYDLIIVDEAHSLGAYPKPSVRTKRIKELAKGKPVLLLSGTPSPESYSQLYHQFYVCESSPFKRYKSFYVWAKEYVHIVQRMINGSRINDYSKAFKEKIEEACKHLFISYSQEEAGFSTNIEEHTLNVLMQTKTMEYLEKLNRYKIVEIDGSVVLGDTPAKLLTKLHQLSSGTIITEEGEYLTVDPSKAYFVRDYFKGKKIAIFYVYKSELELLSSVFSNFTTSPEEFQASTDKVFISQVKRAREGVRLDSAEALIFFNIEYSYLSYEQGKNRIVSKERITPAYVYFLASIGGIESEILNAVHGKQDFTLSYYHGKTRKQRTG